MGKCLSHTLHDSPDPRVCHRTKKHLLGQCLDTNMVDSLLLTPYIEPPLTDAATAPLHQIVRVFNSDGSFHSEGIWTRMDKSWDVEKRIESVFETLCESCESDERGGG